MFGKYIIPPFSALDAFDFTAVNFASASKSFTDDTSGGILTLQDGTHSASIELLGNCAAASFNLAPEGGGSSTGVTDMPPNASVIVQPHG